MMSRLLLVSNIIVLLCGGGYFPCPARRPSSVGPLFCSAFQQPNKHKPRSHHDDDASVSSTTRSRILVVLHSSHQPTNNDVGWDDGDSRSTRRRETSNKNLWSVQECIEQRDQIQFLDGSWYHKGNRNGRKEFQEGPRIPGARYWDMDDIATSKELFPHLNPKGLRVMFPPKSLIAATLQAMNISTITSPSISFTTTTTQDQIIVYGRKGCLFTPRLWYILKTFGHSKVGLMQGSLEDWAAAGGPLDTSPLLADEQLICAQEMVTTPEYLSLRERFQQGDNDKLDRLLDMDTVLEQLMMTDDEKEEQEQAMNKNGDKGRQSILLFDTRGSDNFAKGHLPGAISVPYKILVEPDNPLVLKPREELERILEQLQPLLQLKGNSTRSSPPKVWLSCGSGVSVCHLALVLEELGYPHKPFIYDGSWNEWGSDPRTPKEVVLTPT